MPHTVTGDEHGKRKEKGSNDIELTSGDGAVIIREDGTYNLFMPDKQLDMALSFKHLMMMGFALGLGNEDKRMHKVLGTILNRRTTPRRRARNRARARKQRHAPRRAHGVKLKADPRPSSFRFW